MRIGTVEIHDFCLEFFPGTKAETFLKESCGIADVMTSCAYPSLATGVNDRSN